jgi:hypothetical protein
MLSTLPKGHLSCLSSAFRYTPAISTNVAETFARIQRELKERGTNHPAPGAGTEQVGRPFSRETIDRTLHLLQSGGLGRAPRLIHTSD